MLVLATTGTLGAAREIASLLSGRQSGIGPLGGAYANSSVYPWLVATRYYTASLWLLVVPVAYEDVDGVGIDEASMRAVGELAAGCGALVALFDDQGPSSWTRLTQLWAQALADAAASADVSIALGVRPVG